MCSDPNCANCNHESKMQLVKNGMELGDAIIEVMNDHTRRMGGDSTEDGYAGYIKTMTQSIALAAAAAAMIDNLQVETTQNATMEQIITNIKALVDMKRHRKQKEDRTFDIGSEMLH